MTLAPTRHRLVRSVSGLAQRSQLGARRNALVASTALMERRRERLEVEEFLAEIEQGPRQGTDHHTDRRAGHRTA